MAVFRFVPNAEVQAYLDKRWIAHDSLDGTRHGQWSTLMEAPEHEAPEGGSEDWQRMSIWEIIYRLKA